MQTLQLKKSVVQKVKEGYRLLKAEDFIHPLAIKNKKESTVIHVHDERETFIGKVLLSEQNKGVGWFFTDHENIYFNQDFIENIIEDAIEARSDFFLRTDTNAFRLFNGEGEGLGGVTIDWYDHFLQINWYTRALYQEKDWIVKVLLHYLPQIKGIYETLRFTLQEGEREHKHLYGQEAPQPLVIKENDLKYAIYLGQEMMTGLFLDQREVRQYLKHQVQGQTLLNLFSYTGGFSVAAAAAGAAKTISVDVANRSLEKTQENFKLNDLSIDPQVNEIRVMDVFDYIEYAKRKGLTFDWIVSDPPSFARTKHYRFSAEKNYASLASDLFDLTAVGGFCVLSTNHSGYTREAFQADIRDLLQEKEGQFLLIQSFGLPTDFKTSKDPESQYLKVFVYYRVQ